MFTKKDQKPEKKFSIISGKSHIPSIIALDATIVGNIMSEGDIEIEGRLEGNVACHMVTIRKEGGLKGDIIAESVQIYGEIQGTVKANAVKIFSTARVTGIILYNTLSIENGAYIEGQCRNKNDNYTSPTDNNVSNRLVLEKI